MSFQISPDVDGNKVFLVRSSEIEGRLDPYFYNPEFIAIIKKLKDRTARSLQSIKVDIRKGVFDLSPENYCKTGVPFLRVSDIKAGTINFTNTVFIKKEKHQEERKTEYQPGDLVISKVGTIGEVATLPDEYKKYNISQNVVGLRIDQNIRKLIIPEFLRIVLQSKFGIKQFFRQTTTGVQPKITLDAIRNILIPIPSRKIQSAIVAKMDAAYAAKKEKEAEAKRLLNGIDDYLLRELRIELPEQEENTVQSRIFTRRFSEISGGRFDPIYYAANLDLFNSGPYESVKLFSCVQNIVSGVGAGKQDQTSETDGIIQIRPTNIDREGSLKYDRNVYLPVDFAGSKINIGDVLFNNTNSQELVGKTAILKEDRDLFFSNHITKLTPDTGKAVPDYLMLILNAYQRHKVFYSICTNWNNQSGIGLDLLKSLKIPLPPLPKQTEIADHITQIRNNAKQLRQEAKQGLEQAKQEVEAMILGEDHSDA